MRAASLVRCAVRGGLVAGTLSGAPSGLAWLAGRADPLAATREIGRRATGRPSVVAGGAVHLLLSCLFAAPACALPAPRRPLLAGAAYGLALYAVNFRLLAPRLWPEVLAFDGPAQLGDHVAFGVAVAAVRRR